MRIAREVALYNQGGIQNGIDSAEDRASKVATSFITRVSEAEGIKVHNADDLTDYIQINSNGVDLVNDNESIANFGESARVGKVTSSRFMVNADSLEAYDDSNEKYFEVTPSGMKYGAHTVADTDYADQAEADAISTASADATSKANTAQANAEKVATNFITTDSTGIKVHNTNDSSNYSHIGSGGMDVYQGGALSASFGSSRAQVGKANTGHTIIQASGMQIYGDDGTVELANIGYGEGYGTTTKAPYFTFGTRGNNLVGNYSFTAGRGLLATSGDDAAFGSYNKLIGLGIFYVGNGTSSQRSNALCLSQNGALTVGGSVFCNADGNSENGHLLGVLKVTGSMAGVLPVQISNSSINANMEVIHCVLSNPNAQAGDWTVTTSAGKAIISGATTGTHTDITLYLSDML